MIAQFPADVELLNPLRPGECLIHPFVGGEDAEEHVQLMNGIYVPFAEGLYPSHARVLKVHDTCKDVIVGDMVIFPFMAYDPYTVILAGKAVTVAVCHESKLFGRFDGWDD